MEEKIYKLLDLIKKSGDACPDYEKIKELTPKVLIKLKIKNQRSELTTLIFCK